MNKKKLLIIVFSIFIFAFISASEHGIYLQVFRDVTGTIEEVSEKLTAKLTESEFTILNEINVSTPNIVREKTDKHSKFKAKLLILSSQSYSKMLTSFGNKYLTAGFLRVGLYETPTGIQIIITDPETINRIIFNDLDETKYLDVTKKTIGFKNDLISVLHSAELSEKTKTTLAPVRSDEFLRNGKKDMPMMVGKMTFFQKESQFPIVYSKTNTQVEDVKEELISNINKFKPGRDDTAYHWTKSPENMKWKVVSEIVSSDSNAILLGIMRDRTAALSFHIAGMKRETDNNSTSGIDHVCAYPIEVLIMQDGDDVIVRTQREMFRMDMYFWDAGKWAFMKFMNMPKNLDKSIKRALLAK